MDATDKSADGRRSETFASAIVDQLRQQIIDGTFAPGAKLRIRDLAARFGVGLSPVREALNRLSADGLVIQADLRGFTVAPVSVEDLEELTLTRAWLNERALRESIARGDAEWEERIVIAFHRLTRQPRRLPEGNRLNPEWDAAHRLFHTRLIEACGSHWLVNYCNQLFDVAVRYRNLVRTAPTLDTARSDTEHREIMEATLARDTELAVKRLLAHFDTARAISIGELQRRSGETKGRRSRPDVKAGSA